MKFLSIFLFGLLFIGCECGTKTSGSSPQVAQQGKKAMTSSQTFFMNLNKEPENLHPIRSVDGYSSVVQNYVMETLLVRNLDTYEWEAHLAERWEQSPTHITFTLRSPLYWHDGKPVTAKDVVFSFNAYKDPSFGGIRYISYLENIQSAQALDERTVRFKIKKKYFGNLNALAGLIFVLPEHIYKDKQKKLSRTLTGSGPYILKSYERGKRIQLTQNKNWWGRKVKPNQHRIPRIVFRFLQDENDQLIRMGAGDLDFLTLTPEAFIKKTNKKPYGESILKKEVQNKSAKGYGFIAWNLKKPLFQSQKVRVALAHLMNRELMNQKFRYNKDQLATGPWYSWSDYADPLLSPLVFDPQKAQALLKEDGWVDSDQNGVLEKSLNGQKTEFRFTLIFANPDLEKYLTLYQEDLKKNGIALSLRLMDWSAFLKLLDEKKFSAVSLGWGAGGVEIDPKQIWHSESARDGGSNFISYSNPQVDRLIDKGRGILDHKKRIPIFQQVYRIIAQDAPYLFLFNSPVDFYAVSQKVKMEKDTYPYGWGQKFWQLSQ